MQLSLIFIIVNVTNPEEYILRSAMFALSFWLISIFRLQQRGYVHPICISRNTFDF